MSIVDPASEWETPVPHCGTCSVEIALGRVEGDGLLPDGDPCPDCPRGQEMTEPDSPYPPEASDG